jgi:hypothetical protein
VDGHTIREKVLSLYEHFSKSEPSWCTSGDSWLNTLMLNSLSYIHTHTNTRNDWFYLFEGVEVGGSKGMFSLHMILDIQAMSGA